MASFSSFFSTNTFGDALVKQSQNMARLAFEVRFMAVKRRLDIETNVKREEYNNMDKTLEPVLGGLKRERERTQKEIDRIGDYLVTSQENLKKTNDIILNLIPKLNTAGSAVGPDAEAEFNLLRDRLNKSVQSLKSVNLFEDGLQDRTRSLRAGSNPSGIGDYSSYASILDRTAAVGILVAGGVDGVDVITGISKGYAETIGHVRYDMRQDYNFAKAKLGKSEPLFDEKGRRVFDETGKQVDKPISGLYKKLGEIDKEIERKDAAERLVVLREVQAMEKKSENILKSFSLNFEFMQANAEIMANRVSWNTPDKGSILNLFI